MLVKLKNKLTSTDEKKRLVGNIFSLGVLTGANYILPLFNLPYLVRILGAEYFGLLAFATATITYCILITNYGFNLSATRQISIHRDDQDKVSEIFSSVMMIKTALMMASFVLMLLLVFSIEKFSQHWEVYLITFGTVIGQLLFPVWLFQGLEDMKHITYLNLGTKAFFTICVFLFVKEQSDYLLVPLLTGMGLIFAGIWSLYLAKKQLNVRFVWQSTATLKFQLAEGWHVFLSSMAVSLYTISTTFILGLFTNSALVGYFAAADKIVQAVKGLYTPVSHAIYPLISKKIHVKKQAGLAFISETTWFVGTGMFVISTISFLMAQPIVNLLFGPKYQQSVLLLQIMAFLPFITTLSNIYGIQTMLNLGYKQAFSRILILNATIGMSMSFIFVPRYQALGAACVILLVEILVTIMMLIFLRKRDAD